VIVLVVLCWLFWGRHHFVGPVKTIEEDEPVDSCMK